MPTSLRRLTGVDRDQAYRGIQELVTLGILEGAPSAGRGAHDQLTNSEFCRLYGLTRFVAARELKRLVDDGYLLLSGSGRGAHYLPGPVLAQSLQK